MTDEHFWDDVITLIRQARIGGASPLQSETERETLLTCAIRRAGNDANDEVMHRFSKERSKQ